MLNMSLEVLKQEIEDLVSVFIGISNETRNGTNLEHLKEKYPNMKIENLLCLLA